MFKRVNPAHMRSAQGCANRDFYHGGGGRWVRLGQGEVTKSLASGRIVLREWCGVAHLRWRGLYDVGDENSALHW